MSVFSCREKDIEIDNYLPMLHSGAMSQVFQACMEKKLQSSKNIGCMSSKLAGRQDFNLYWILGPVIKDSLGTLKDKRTCTSQVLDSQSIPCVIIIISPEYLTLSYVDVLHVTISY